ncbi:hypothetical protein [Stutzerimonas kunmingensis]|uniref:hypothetical protein n=1 Tax=Stutzerimonas kunmingensis TaxID=1211807 RepID=UPI0028ABFFCE|nr:hypothetical protein [Stutzerimonas kunmingensis]
MRYVVVLWTVLLVACDRHWDGLAGDPIRRETQHALHIAVDGGPSMATAEVYRHRSFSGKGGSDEFGTLRQLPAIPPTFDGPVETYLDESRRPLARPKVAYE